MALCGNVDLYDLFEKLIWKKQKLFFFLSANPRSTSILELDREIREISEKIRASEFRDSIILLSAWAVRPNDLMQSLYVHRPQIVHFSGHGTQDGNIVLVDDSGNPKPVSPAAMRHLFSTLLDNIRIVILNACYSKEQAEAITEVVDCAIGMDSSVSDKAAIIFVAAFYRAIGFGRSVRDAFEQGITALMLEGVSEENTPKFDFVHFRAR